MVYSTVPVRIDFSGKVPPVDLDDSLSYGSSERSMSTIEGQHYLVENWNSGEELFDHRDAGLIANQVNPRDLFNVPKPSVGLPALKDLYPEEDTSGRNKEKAVRGVACHSNCMSNISKLAPWGRVNTRARVEMLHHQLKKPFSAGKKIVKRTGAMECFKEKDSDNMQNSAGEVTEDDVSSNDDFSQLVSRNRRFSNREGGLDGKAVEQNVEVLAVEKNVAVVGARDEGASAEGDEAGGRRWRYACNLWPVNDDAGKDPPGHYYKTEQAVKLHFYNDFSEQMSLKDEACADDDTTAVVPTRLRTDVYSRSYLEDIDERVVEERQFLPRNLSTDTGDDSDGSVFVLEDGLD
jgi:hypothetical protein